MVIVYNHHMNIKAYEMYGHTHNVLSSTLLCCKIYLVPPGMDNLQTKNHHLNLWKPNSLQTYNLSFEGQAMRMAELVSVPVLAQQANNKRDRLYKFKIHQFRLRTNAALNWNCKEYKLTSWSSTFSINRWRRQREIFTRMVIQNNSWRKAPHETLNLFLTTIRLSFHLWSCTQTIRSQWISLGYWSARWCPNRVHKAPDMIRKYKHRLNTRWCIFI